MTNIISREIAKAHTRAVSRAHQSWLAAVPGDGGWDQRRAAYRAALTAQETGKLVDVAAAYRAAETAAQVAPNRATRAAFAAAWELYRVVSLGIVARRYDAADAARDAAAYDARNATLDAAHDTREAQVAWFEAYDAERTAHRAYLAASAPVAGDAQATWEAALVARRDARETLDRAEAAIR